MADAELAVSEVATNAFQHARPVPGLGPLIPPELWVYARTWPTPTLVVSVFDAVAAATPRLSSADLLADYGKGMNIIAAVTTAWGCRPSRSRLATPLAHGKAVWFALPLPGPWPGHRVHIPPTTAEVEARTIGARIHTPAVAAGRNPDVERYWGIPAIPSYPFAGSAIVIWDSGTPYQPLTNTPPRGDEFGRDPHPDPRNSADARRQKAVFLTTGKVADVCAGAPCTAEPAG